MNNIYHMSSHCRQCKSQAKHELVVELVGWVESKRLGTALRVAPEGIAGRGQGVLGEVLDQGGRLVNEVLLELVPGHGEAVGPAVELGHEFQGGPQLGGVGRQLT